VEGLDAYGRTPAADCLRLIMLTGCRPGEAMLATWEQFDAQPGFWIKPSSHTKQRREHRLPLSAPARQLVADVRSLRGEINPNEFVFPGQIPGQPLQQLRSCWDAVCKHAGLSGVRIYDLRHTFAATGAGDALCAFGRRPTARGRRQDCQRDYQGRAGRQGCAAAGVKAV